MLPDTGGAFFEHPYSDPERVLWGTISGIIVVLGVAHLQVDEPGIPSGLTLKRAFLPCAVVGAFAFGAARIIANTSGSIPYATLSVVIYVLTTVVASLGLRALRRRGN